VRGLFLKIFLWFWATVLSVGIALVLSFVLGPRGSFLPWRSAHAVAQRIVGVMDHAGQARAAAMLANEESQQSMYACLFDATGLPIMGNGCREFADIARHAAQTAAPGNDVRAGKERNILRLRGARGRTYIYASESQWGPPAIKNSKEFALRWGVMLVVSSSICYLLTRRLTRPILQLREASRRIADGNLDARVTPAMEKRGDEFGDLARDFNTMAARIDDLLSSQKQLISDVSHELRSPLARLNVALDLARRRLGADPAFERMDADLARLEEMIASLLTVAKLESHAAPVDMTAVALTALVAEVVGDAELEARPRGCSLAFASAGEISVNGREPLLRSAVENVVRNAVNYTAEGTEVGVHLSLVEERVVLRVSDRGPGVGEQDLENIFKPFYRVADARDRASGGTGLGLAIADRVVKLHGGQIWAANRAGGGLEVTIDLPKLIV
jgi:signal transduction histidine kinase